MSTFCPSILIVEDDARILEELCAALTAGGYEPLPVRSLAGARRHLTEPLQLVVLDLGLPDGDGLDLCRKLSRSRPELPVIVLTARDSVAARIKGLDAGADDYVVKPFHTLELIARVRSVLRRRGAVGTTERVEVGSTWADAALHQAGRGDLRFDLKPREFELLLFLLRHPGRPWTRDQLLERVWGPDFRGDTRTVDVHVRRLRAQLEPEPGSPRFLHTEWGVGYRFEELP